LITGLFSTPVFISWAASLLVYLFAIFCDASIQYRNPVIGLMSVYASMIMLTGYGLGMLRAIFMRFVLNSKKTSEKPEITKGN
jgi:hypothetical protein